jgi:hypothetical protein
MIISPIKFYLLPFDRASGSSSGGRQTVQDEGLSATMVQRRATFSGCEKKAQVERKGVRAMADSKVLLTILAAFAAGLFLIGFVFLDWRFFAVSGLTSLAITAIAVKAGGWSAINPFDRGH